ncbi:MAG TPA: hypothetical protein VMW34_13660 [Anaerolineales bacterium]|jgi:hypothetical protein|nr:hypothetical protein [Anaerolineales bacterium]
MDLDRAFLVIVLTVGAVILFNVIIYLSVRRGNEVTTIDLMRKAARRARNPWQDEDDALKELSEIVSGLQSGKVKIDSVDEQIIKDD